jgi:hypothetical protein
MTQGLIPVPSPMFWYSAMKIPITTPGCLLMLIPVLKMIHDACGVIIHYSPKSQKSASVKAATVLTHFTISRLIHPLLLISVLSS